MTRKTAVASFPLGGILFLLLTDLLVFWGVLWPWGSRVLSDGSTDLALHFLWWRQFGFDQIRQGNLPLWNPHFLCGNPFLGGFQAGLLYPVNWMHLFLPLPLAFNVEMVLHVFLAGACTYLWGWSRGWNPLACVLAGMAFMFGGTFFLHLYPGHLPNLAAMAWAPLIFLSLDLLLGPSWKGGILLGIFAVSMQILAGHPQYLLYTGVMALAYLGINMINHPERRRLVLGFVFVYLGASLITAVQLWTGSQAFLECSRSVPMAFRSAASFSFPPQNLVTAILPNFLGDALKGHYWSQWYFWEGSLFLGCSAFLLALLTLGRGMPAGNRSLWVCAGVALLLAFGAHTPLYGILYEWVPWFDGMRGIGKFAFLAGLFLAMLCGAGMDRWAGNWITPRGWIPGVLFTGLCLAAGGIGVLFSSEQGATGAWGKFLVSRSWLQGTWERLDPSILEALIQTAGRDCGKSLLTGSVLFLLFALLLRLRLFRKGTSVLALAMLVAFELLSFAGAHRPTFDQKILESKADSLRDFYRKNPGEYRVMGTGAAALGTGGFDLWEDEPMVLGRYGRFIARSQGIREGDIFSTSPLFRTVPDIYAMLRLKYRIAWGEDPIRIQPMSFRPFPRMYLAGRWEVLSGEGPVLDRLLEEGFNPAGPILLEQDPGIGRTGGSPLGRISWKDIDTDTIEVTAEVRQASLLVVTDNYARGWKAKGFLDSDRRIYPVVPGNGILRVVPLPAGRHHFILVYEPSAFQMGRWVSLLSLLVYVVILWRFLKKKSLLRPNFP